MTSLSIPNVLSIAGSDSSGGAGVQADLKVFSALGVYGASVITAITAQNTLGVMAVDDVSIDVIQAQIQAVFADIEIGVVKIGMLSNADVIALVANELASLKRINKIQHIVLDPVMVATSGDALLAENAVSALREKLIPMATLVTPNLPEASALIGQSVATKEDMESVAPLLRALKAENILLKGGHLDSDALDCETSADLLITSDSTHWLSDKRVKTNNTHGTGCTLSSAIAAYLAKGETLENAVFNAKAYIQSAIENADRLSVGTGHGPVHHFHQWY